MAQVQSRKGQVMQIALLGIDLGKNSCSVAGIDASGEVLLRRRLHRNSIPKLAARFPGCIIAMEACCGAHHLGRVLRKQGHVVRLMSPEYVRPYVKAQKNDDRDAEAIAEAATRPTMRFVALKSEEQLDLQSLHRARDRLVGERTALINQLRAILLERGITIPQGHQKLESMLPQLIETSGDLLSDRIRRLLEEMWQELGDLTRRITSFDDEFTAFARNDASCQRLESIPGIGSLNATAFVAAIDEAQAFARGLAGAGAAADDHRRKASAVGHQQTGERISAPHADPWCKGSHAASGAHPDRNRLVAVNAAANFPKSAEVKFPNYADGVVMERWPFFGGRPRGFGGGVKAGGVISAFERTCSGMSSAC